MSGWVLLVPGLDDATRVRRWVGNAHTAGRPVTSVTADPVAALTLLVHGDVVGVLLSHGAWQLAAAGIVDLGSVPAPPNGPRRPAWTVPPAEQRPQINPQAVGRAQRPGISWPGVQT